MTGKELDRLIHILELLQDDTDFWELCHLWPELTTHERCIIVTAVKKVVEGLDIKAESPPENTA